MSSPATDALVGTLLDGRYRIRSHIADGGMASVYAGLDERLEREVALKVMKPSLASDPAFVERFQREARSAARLSHPGIVAVYDQGSDDHRVFLVMELVPGKNLREVMAAEGALTPRAALDFLDQVLQALGAAHAAGLVHRDVKPENVILRDDGAVKVADFGLMRAAVSGSGTATAQTGVLLGTVAYLSPEQVERGVADARSDVYAAGLVLFEMLTGTKAFVGETAIQVAYQHVYGQVPAPSSRIPTLPPALDQLVAHATAREPADRPADARAFLREVRRVRAGLSTEQLDRRTQPNGSVAAPAPTLAVRQGPGSPTQVIATPAEGRTEGRTEVLPMPTAATPAMPVAVPVAVPVAMPVTVPVAMPVAAAGTTQVVPVAPTATMPRPSGATAAPNPVDQVGELLGAPPRNSAPQRRRRSAWPVVLLLLLLAAAAAALWWFLAGPGGRTTVPAVTGQSQSVAAGRLGVAHLSTATRRAYSESVRSGVVIASDPRSGVSVSRDATVTLTVSRGPERHTVPRVQGRSESDARTAIGKAHLKVGSVDTAYDPTAPKGQVLSSDPQSGTPLHRGATVDLVVSRGPQPVVVADWTGKPVADATTALQAEGLKVNADQQQNSTTVAAGSVLTQTPPGGSALAKGDTVTLVVSSGPQQVSVPDVTTQAVSDARKALTDVGFTVQVNAVIGGGSGPIARVVSQFPTGGSLAPAGSVVTLTVL